MAVWRGGRVEKNYWKLSHRENKLSQKLSRTCHLATPPPGERRYSRLAEGQRYLVKRQGYMKIRGWFILTASAILIGAVRP